MTSESDNYLLEQFTRAHDAMAFDEIARRYRGMVFSTARRVTQSHHDAEDVAQNCFLELARKAGSIRTSLPAFLHATATRRAIDILREQHRRRKHEQIAASERIEPVVPDPSERPWDEISPEVDRAIDRLPDELQTPIILYFLRGLSAMDIAMEMGLSRGVIERRLQVGIRRLRGDLSTDNRIVPVGVLGVGLKSSIGARVPASLTAATGRMALFAGIEAAGPSVPSGLNRPAIKWLVSAAAVVAVTVGAIAGYTTAFSSSDRSTAYDTMWELYRPYLSDASSSGFPWHVATMRTEPTAFWRGSQPLFFKWCADHCTDWLAEKGNRLICSATPDIEDARRLPVAANADNSARIPIELELLQGMISVRLAADRDLGSGADATRVARTLVETYRAALTSDAESAPPPLPTEELDRYVDATGQLRRIVLNRQGKVSEFLRPSPLPVKTLQTMLEDAVRRSARLAQAFGEKPVVRDARARVRESAVVTQGQLELVVQIDGASTLLDMKQQTPSPAELAGLVTRDPRPAGCRAADDEIQLTGGACSIGWCDSQGLSFTVAPLAPEQMPRESRKDRWLDPVQAARWWATRTAVTHHWLGDRSQLASCLTADLTAKLVTRSADYLAHMNSDFRAFRDDPRVGRDRAAADTAAQRWLEETHLPSQVISENLSESGVQQ